MQHTSMLVVHFDNKIISDLLANGNLMLMSCSSL